MRDIGHFSVNDRIEENQEIPAWKLLDEAVRKWAVQSQYEKDLDAYQNRKIIYQD